MEDDIKFRLTDIETLLNKIFKILEGNGDEGGLVTKVALVEQKVEDIPSPGNLRWYAAIGGSAVFCIGMIFYLLSTAIKSLWNG